MPRLKRNKEKLMSKTSHMEKVKGSFHIIEKKNDKGKIDKSTTDSLVSRKGLCKIKFMTDNLEDSQTTSNVILKPQGADIRSDQHVHVDVQFRLTVPVLAQPFEYVLFFVQVAFYQEKEGNFYKSVTKCVVRKRDLKYFLPL